MPHFTEISLKVICCSLKPQNHLPALIHKAYLRYLKAINVKNVTNSHVSVHWYADRLPGSTFTLLVASANYKPLMATVNYRYRTLPITIQDIHKNRG